MKFSEMLQLDGTVRSLRPVSGLSITGTDA